MDSSIHETDAFTTLAEKLHIADDEIARRKAFIELGEEDEKNLREFHEVAEREAEEVIESFYRHLFSFDGMRSFFSDESMLQRVKNAQKAYFLRMTEGDYDADYVENRLQVGAVHERIDLPLKYYLGMFNFYLREMGPRIFRQLGDDPERAMATYSSLMKLICFDMELAIDTYIDARESTIKALQRETIRELSTPVLPFREGMLLLPIIGKLETNRARQLTEHLLDAVRYHRAKVIVIDITGVETVDSRVANHLVQTIDAVRLMGARVIVSGISPEIALTMVTLGIDLGSVLTVGDMQSGIEKAEEMLGYRVERRLRSEDESG